MFLPTAFDVTGTIDFDGDNVFAVVIERAPDEQPQVSKTRYVRTHKSRMTYWWDFCPRMIHQGIWDNVSLEATGDVRIEDAFVRPTLTDDFARADVAVTTSLHASAIAMAVRMSCAEPRTEALLLLTVVWTRSARITS